MAKTRDITTLDCEANAREQAAGILRFRFAEILEFHAPVLNSEDIEAVHDMRVAVRRLRSAMRDFAPLMRKKPLEKIKKDLKIIADALGAARDEDVAIRALEKLQTKAKDAAIQEGIGKLIEARRKRREWAQIDLTETLANNRIEDLQNRFNEAITASARPKKSAEFTSFSEAGRGIVGKSLDEFCKLTDSIYQPLNDTPLHKLRIAAKRLRYAIELFAACWGESLAAFADEIAAMQSFLGEVHDCDIWIESLGKNLRHKNETNESGNYQAAVWLLSKFIKKRTKEYRSALKLWNEWKANYFVQRLRATIS